MSHHLADDDPVVTVGGRVETVDRLGRDAERRVEAECRVGHRHVVVDRLREGDDVEPLLRQVVGVLLRPAAPEADQDVEVVPPVGFDDHVRHVEDLAAHGHGIRLVAARPEDRPPLRQDPRESRLVEHHGPVLHQAAEPFPEADHLHPVETDGRLPQPAKGGVEAGAVAPRRQDPDVLGHQLPPVV